MKTTSEQKLLEQLDTVAHNAKVARQAWLDGDFLKVAIAVNAVEVGAGLLDEDLARAHEARKR